MTKTLRKILIILISIIVIIGGLIFFNFNHDYILIHSDYSNTAIKIERKLTIWNLSQRLRLNLNFGHACGYQTTIKMIDNHKITSEIPFNVECEEFIRSSESINRDIRAYYKQSQENPTHNVYNLIIPVKYDIDSVFDILDKESVDYVMLDGELNQFPVIEILTEHKFDLPSDKSKWDGIQDKNEKITEDKLMTIVDEIKKKYPVKSIGRINTPMFSTISYQKAIEIYFELNVDTTGFANFVNRTGINIEKCKIPDYYWIPIIVKSGDDVFKKLDGLKFIDRILEYPDNE